MKNHHPIFRSVSSNMTIRSRSGPPLFSLFMSCLCCVWFLLLVQRTEAQAKTDPIEVRALNSMFGHWGISAPQTWNMSGEPCSGEAISSKNIEDMDFNPAIKCDDCSSDNGTTCHIIRLKVVSMDVKGTIPREIANFTKLSSLNMNQNLLTGPLPEFLGTLTELQHLNLNQNHLTGPLPAFLGNLTKLKYLTVGTNALSGTIPKELGNLRKLELLSFSTNNFSGPLPRELGNLSNLQELYIDSAGVSGEIPATFANLRNLQILWASDNHFTGKIPDFIGNWTSLTTLRLQGNSFEGPIPSAFSNLTNLIDLRISELSNKSSSLEFIKNMESLKTLILRNSMISGSLPSNFWPYQSLSHLDLSFNSLTGELPTSLFNLNSLSFLFLGNNLLSGTLPPNKSDELFTIDLSYNGLSGSFPSWVNQSVFQLNLVGNYFVLDSSDSSGLPSGLNCLQRTFPCYRGSPRYSRLAIKCGGPQIRSHGILFEQDSEILGTASYYVTDLNNWAVSNTGRFKDNIYATYTRTHLYNFANTLDSDLFQTARLSPGSLRYYGLGLENGIYTVNLKFAETEFPDSPVWQSLGRRIFDIFIQGDLVWKDFDIRKEAGGSSFRAVSKDFKANVTENYLEIHLFWAGRGTCCIPIRGVYGPSISAISVTPDFEPTIIPLTQIAPKKNRISLIARVLVAAGVVGFIVFFAILILKRRRKRMSSDDDEELMGMDAKPSTFCYAKLKAATEDFISSNKLGEGGFGPVYKGKLSDGRTVAVKQLSVASHQGKSQFEAEIATISAVQHRNLVKLYGCCIEGDKRLLVYEYLENKSLDQALFGKSSLHLNWPTRFGICLGTARGLAYLHEDSNPRIVHRDVKASNILLDADLNPKISDFGLAKLYDDKKTHISTRVAGTIGYLAPEYAMRGHLTEKADVFGFGVVALEILSGRPNSDTSLDAKKIYLLEWAWHLHDNNRELELMDQTLEEFDAAEAIRMIGVALLCIQASPVLRPSMSRVVAMLSGDVEVTTVTSRPSYLTEQFHEMSRTMSNDALMVTPTRSQLDTSSPSMGSSADRSTVSETRPLVDEVFED